MVGEWCDGRAGIVCMCMFALYMFGGANAVAIVIGLVFIIVSFP